NKVGYFTRKRDGLFNNCHLVHRDQQGKFMIIDFFYNNISCRLINIHAPNIDTHRKRFFLGLRQWIVTNCIIIGDFNITLTKSDISNNCTFSEDYSRNTLFDIITQNSLVDIWRLFHPGKKQFTRKQVILGKLKQSRLDLLQNIFQNTSKQVKISNRHFNQFIASLRYSSKKHFRYSIINKSYYPVHDQFTRHISKYRF
uniref:Endonuclease/exonuclease/phosphatase domain-containing protein n=1 Tax=Poecilia latipinna TaxID=48699 RepID=A0A3B3U0H7_9TELE